LCLRVCVCVLRRDMLLDFFCMYVNECVEAWTIQACARKCRFVQSRDCPHPRARFPNPPCFTVLLLQDI